MNCPNCGNENSPGTSVCEWCGSEIGTSPKRKTRMGGDGAPPAAPVAGPGPKRKTMFEPDASPPGGPPVQPQMGIPSPPGAPPPPAADPPTGPPIPPGGGAGGWAPAPSPSSAPTTPDDYFGNPPPSRPPLHNPDDPFQPSGGGPAYGAPAPAAAPATPAAPRGKGKTIIDTSGAVDPQRRIVGALFVFAHAQDTGVIRPLFSGRNTLGRGDDRDVALDDGRVSSEHGYLFLRPDGASYVDTSTNGSLVNGQVVHGTQVEVTHGAILTLGNLQAVLVVVPTNPFEGR